MTAVIKNLQFLLAVFGNAVLLVDVTWFHMGCFNVKALRVTLQRRDSKHVAG